MIHATFKKKQTRYTWAILIIFFMIVLFIIWYRQKSWLFMFCFLPSLIQFITASRENYLIAESGEVKITSIWNNHKVLTQITRLTYQAKTWHYSKLRVDHAHGFTMINPEDPKQFMETLKALDPTIVLVYK